ncbi:hypothetical protein IAU60_004274 [Kwoniella sp. DSM 27419]
MPYIYNMPLARDDYDRRASGMTQQRADTELLKLLNGDQQMFGSVGKVGMTDGRSRAHMDDADSDVGVDEYSYAGEGPWLISDPDLSHTFRPVNYDLSTPTADPPFLHDMINLDHFAILQDEEHTTRRRYSRMSFNGHVYPPVPPDPRTLPRPVDDWGFEEPRHSRIPSFDHDLGVQNVNNGGFRQQSGPHASYPPTDLYAYDHQQYLPPLPQQAAWTPPHEQTWGHMMDFRAPVLHPRLVHLPERPITPHDTYRYPASHSDHIYVTPQPAVTDETMHAAFAVWYANQVIGLLVVPGQYRPGVGGASEDVWGVGGREKDGWLRVGRSPPDYSKPWGRMGMTHTPVLAPRKVFSRRPELESRDPWNVSWVHANKPTVSFVNFILDMIQRMNISTSSIVAAVWFLTGLGLHDGDGPKGSALRALLREHRSDGIEAVERRVAILGLMLAGKWLDDNSFLTKSWSEVTTVPVKELDKMERFALSDLHYSLHVPVSSWVDHVNKIYASLISKALPDEVDVVVIPVIDEMVTEARECELNNPRSDSHSLPMFERRSSAEELPAAADQAISRDWGSFARPYAQIGQVESQLWDSTLDDDVQMARAERSVDALVNDDDVTEAEDDEEEFLDYDGAKRWLPTESEFKRSASGSSDTSFVSTEYHRRLVTQAGHISTQGNSPAQAPCADWTRQIPTRDSAPWDAADGLSHLPDYSKYNYGSVTNTRAKTTSLDHSTDRHGGAHIEPGITVMSPPESAVQTRSRIRSSVAQRCTPDFDPGLMYRSFVGKGYGISASASKRWGTSAAQW